MNKLKWGIFVILLGLTGCMNTEPQVTSTSVTRTIPTQTIVIQNSTTTVTPSSTNLPISTPTLTATSDNTTGADIDINCLELLDTLPMNVTLNGRAILVAPRLQGYEGTDAWFDFEIREVVPIQKTEFIDIGGYLGSPNGQYIGYHEIYLNHGSGYQVESESFVIIDLHGNEISRIPGIETEFGWYISHWLDNERLVAVADGDPYVLNAFSYETIELPRGYQNFLDDQIIGSTSWKGVINQGLDRVLYITGDNTLKLLDILDNKVLYQSNPKIAYLPMQRPTWTIDGTRVIFAYLIKNDQKRPEELFSLSHDGELLQLTDLNSSYENPQIENFSISPDNKQLAFFFHEWGDTNPDSRLGILDLDTLHVTLYCNLVGLSVLPDSPVWSPDSTKVLFERVESDGHTVHTVLLDIVNNYAAIIAENLSPAIWVNNAP